MWSEYDSSFAERKSWKEAREEFLIQLKEQGLSADSKLVESQMEKIKEAIWENASIRQVMNVALEIVVPETIGSRLDFWQRIMALYLVMPLGRIGCSIAELLTNDPDGSIPIAVEAETDDIDRDEFIYNLSSRYQLSLFNSINAPDDSYDELDVKPSVERQLLNNTDVLTLFALKDIFNGNYLKARSRLRKVVERLDEPDESIETMLETINSSDGMAGSSLRTAAQKPTRREAPKIGRNASCPCGSGLKYKHCCGKNV